jgi:lipoprotein-anchoring transpeptidase ErfK/SrfK
MLLSSRKTSHGFSSIVIGFALSGTLALISAPTAVNAQDISTAPAHTLDEYLSPDELEQEIALQSNRFDAEIESSAITRSTSTADRVVIEVNKSREGTHPDAQTVHVYVDGNLTHTWFVSTGREHRELAPSGKRYFSRTPTGEFHITSRVKHYWSQTWNAPMPFAQFFVGGIALHATVPLHEPELGRRASGGCVRLQLQNAETLWNLVSDVGANHVLIRVINPIAN